MVLHSRMRSFVLILCAVLWQHRWCKASTIGQPVERCTVYTFFEDLTVGLSPVKNKKVFLSHQDHLDTIKIWLRNWWANGWDPVLLKLADATSHPDFEFYRAKFAALPTVNWKQYETLCYLRWLAFAGKGGGVFVDYDIMNFPVSKIPKVAGKCGAEGALVSYPNFLPMLIFGNSTESQRLVKYLAEYQLEPDDFFNGQPHISDMLIVRKSRQYIFSQLLPNPPFLWHFSTFSKASLKEATKHMTRSEWIRRNLTLDFVRRHRIRIFSPDGPRGIDSALDSLLEPIKSCPDDPQEGNSIMLQEAKLRSGEFAICDFRVVDRLGPVADPQVTTDLIIFEPVVERVLRPLAKSPFLRQSGDNPNDIISYASNPSTQNIFVKKLSGCDKGEDVGVCLERAKQRLSLSSPRTVLGFLGRFQDSKMVLEYAIGFPLPELKEPYIPATIKHRLRISDKAKESILDMNWADRDLYQYAEAIFNEQLARIQGVEGQLLSYKK